MISVSCITIAIQVQTEADFTEDVGGVTIPIEVTRHAHVGAFSRWSAHARDVGFIDRRIGVVTVLVQVNSTFMDRIGLVTIAVDVPVQACLRHQIKRGAIAVQVQCQAAFIETVVVVAIAVGIQSHRHFVNDIQAITVFVQVHTAFDIACSFGRQHQLANQRAPVPCSNRALNHQVFTRDQLQSFACSQGAIQEGQCATGFQNQRIRAQRAGQ